MSKSVLGHLDQAERECEQHPVDHDALLHLAAVGARTPSFNHDIASKIQGVMMSVDEISEVAASEEVSRLVETAQSALRELNQLLQQHRAMTKAPATTRTSVAELVTRAAQRAGVKLEGGAPGDTQVDVAAQLALQALASAIDVAAGTDRRRSLALTARLDGDHVELQLPVAASAKLAGETLAIAAWSLSRSHGELRCSERVLVIRLRVAR